MAGLAASILLVEDDAGHVKLIQRAFAAVQDQFELRVAHDLRQARRALADTPDLLIVDWLLPDGEGTELLAAGQADPACPVVILTSQGNETLAVAAMKAGALDYVVKSDETLTNLPQIARRSLREWEHIQERRRAEAERDRLFELSIDMITVAGFDGYFKQVNPALVRTLGWSEQELLNRPWMELVHPEDRARTDQAALRLKSGEILTHFENRNQCKDGSFRWVSWSATSVRPLQLVYSVGRDITEQKQTEAILREQDERLRTVQKMEALGRLAGGVAHDFNNLLMVISGFTDLALEELARDSAARPYLAEVKAAAHRASGLTRQLLAFSRKQILQPRSLSLNHVIADLERMLRRLIGEHIQVRTKLAPGLPCIHADPTQMEQVILNLAINARDAMPAGGTLTIETAVEASQVLLRIEDTGSGMDAETLARIYEPFFTTKEPGKGSGLGLATVYGIVEQTGGRIEAASRPGQGTRFQVAFAAVQSAEDRPAPSVPAEERSLAGLETILVVEDDPVVRRLTVQVLEKRGYHVLQAGHGREACQVSQAHPDVIHLLLTDVIMPHMGGHELAQQLAAARPGIKALFMSGYTDDDWLRQHIQTENLVYLQKPVAPETLAAKIREVLDS